MRNRKVNATGKENEVLLDENLVECMSPTPIHMFVGLAANLVPVASHVSIPIVFASPFQGDFEGFAT